MEVRQEAVVRDPHRPLLLLNLRYRHTGQAGLLPDGTEAITGSVLDHDRVGRLCDDHEKAHTIHAGIVCDHNLLQDDKSGARERSVKHLARELPLVLEILDTDDRAARVIDADDEDAACGCREIPRRSR